MFHCIAHLLSLPNKSQWELSTFPSQERSALLYLKGSPLLSEKFENVSYAPTPQKMLDRQRARCARCRSSIFCGVPAENKCLCSNKRIRRYAVMDSSRQ